jgi:transcriptional regulator with XRE-family HTH domain
MRRCSGSSAESLSQRSLSSKTGIQQPTLSVMEKGESNPTLRLMTKLADGLRMNLVTMLVPPEK